MSFCPCLLETSGDFSVFPPLKCTWTHICYRWFCSFHKGLVNMAKLLCDTILLGNCWILISPVGSSCFSSTMLMAYIGYLNFIRTSSRCCSSFNNWGVEHTALAQWWRRLSHYICMPGCDGCPTVDINQCEWASCTLLLLGFHFLGITSVSRNSMEPSDLVSSNVNRREGSSEFMCCKNSSLCICCCVAKVSSTYPFQILGGFTAVVMALCPNGSM